MSERDIVGERGPELIKNAGGLTLGEVVANLRFSLDYACDAYKGTPEQQARAERDRVEREARRLEVLPLAREWWRKINASPSVAVQAILNMHSASDERPSETVYCESGDHDGEFGELWPCPTLTVLAAAIDLPVPDGIDLLKSGDLDE